MFNYCCVSETHLIMFLLFLRNMFNYCCVSETRLIILLLFLRNVFNYCFVSGTRLIILLLCSGNTLIYPVKHVWLSSFCVSESHLWMGSWPSGTSQVYWHRCWPAQFKEGILFLSHRLAYGEEASRREDKGKVHRHERHRERPNSYVAAQVISHLLCFWVYW